MKLLWFTATSFMSSDIKRVYNKDGKGPYNTDKYKDW